MNGSVPRRLALAAALLLALPTVVGAQVEEPAPEGVEWHLASYAVDGQVTPAPWYIDATLLLEDGTASGSTGCNRYSVGYALDGASLVFDEAMTLTRMACAAEQGKVEDAFLANLPLTATWAVEDDLLTLADTGGESLLAFEHVVIVLTASDVAAIEAEFADRQAQLDRLDERITNINIKVLRERLRDLEAALKALAAEA